MEHHVDCNVVRDKKSVATMPCSGKGVCIVRGSHSFQCVVRIPDVRLMPSLLWMRCSKLQGSGAHPDKLWQHRVRAGRAKRASLIMPFQGASKLAHQSVSDELYFVLSWTRHPRMVAEVNGGYYANAQSSKA